MACSPKAPAVQNKPPHKIIIYKNVTNSQPSTRKKQSNNILGGDSGDLTEAGRQYVILLNKFVKRVRFLCARF